MSNNIKPSKYPVNPDEQADLLDQAINAGRAGKQDELVSGTNIKTVNGNSLLGSGNIVISGNASWGNITGTISSQVDLQNSLNGKQDVLTSGTNIKTINSTSLLGSGDVAVQPTLVSGTNIKTINGNSLLGSGNLAIQMNPRTIASVNGNAITGTSIQISASVLIPAGTLVANNTLYIKAFINKTAGSGVTTPRYYVNTANTLTGATYLGAGGGMSTSVYFQRFERNIFFDGTNLNSFLSGTSAANDYSLSGITLTAFNPLVDNYLIFAISNGTTTPDNGNFKRVIVQVYD